MNFPTYMGTGTNLRHVTRKGKWLLHLSSRYEYATFEWGTIPCGGKTVSTRAHIQEVQPYLCKSVSLLPVTFELCS